MTNFMLLTRNQDHSGKRNKKLFVLQSWMLMQPNLPSWANHTFVSKDTPIVTYIGSVIRTWVCVTYFNTNLINYALIEVIKQFLEK